MTTPDQPQDQRPRPTGAVRPEADGGTIALDAAAAARGRRTAKIVVGGFLICTAAMLASIFWLSGSLGHQLDRSGISAAHVAVLDGNPDALAAAIASGANLDDRADGAAREAIKGRTALDLAAEAGETAMVLALAAAGADPDVTGTEGITPLARCVAAGDVAAVRALLDAGADQAIGDVYGRAARDRISDAPAGVQGELRELLSE